jgi:hypothetical protein
LPQVPEVLDLFILKEHVHRLADQDLVCVKHRGDCISKIRIVGVSRRRCGKLNGADGNAFVSQSFNLIAGEAGEKDRLAGATAWCERMVGRRSTFPHTAIPAFAVRKKLKSSTDIS